MSVTMTSNFDGFRAAVRKGVADGLTAVQVEFQKQIGRQLNKHASNRSKGGVPSAPGSPPGRATGTLARSWQTPARNGTAIEDNSNISDPIRPRIGLGSTLAYARIHEFGGMIYPKGKKGLAIPIHPEAKAASAKGLTPREAFGDDLDFIARPGKPPLLIRYREGRGKRGTRWDIMYVINKSVRMPARPYVRPAAIVTQGVAAGIATPFFARAVKGFS